MMHTVVTWTNTVRRHLSMTLGPLCLMLFVPNLVIFLWYTVALCEGSYSKMIEKVFDGRSFLGGVGHVWGKVNSPSTPVVLIFFGYCIYALVMMTVLPGKRVYGPLTPKGNTPVYKDNGFQHYIITICLFWIVTYVLRPYGLSPSILYDRFDEVLFLLNIFSIVFCLGLYLKGTVAPSTTDSGSSGNVVFDYYWGLELYPRVFGIDIKGFTNCRFGMTVWALLVCVHVVKSFELHGLVDSMLVSAFLQLFYITKFFWWETGYLSTIDMMVDHAGFYICWGCLVFVPGFYTSPSYFLVEHPVQLGLASTLGILVLGVISILINFLADNQKQQVRASQGECLVWGKKAEVIHAKYTLETGEVKDSLLLASGWWGLARHFHYVPEVALAACWTLPAMFTHVLPWSYVIYLTILLTHRSGRDDEKCSRKYGAYWDQYCTIVPYRIVPYLY